MLYLLQVLIYSALMYGIYMLVLKNKTQHNWSRLYLLSAAVLPLVLPLLKMQLFAVNVDDNTVYAAVSEPVMIVSASIKAAPSLSTSTIMLMVYVSIAALLLVRLAWQYMQVIRFVRSHEVENVNGTRIIRAHNIQPGSWANYIFLPTGETDDAIIKHEQEHIRLRHSADIALIKLLQCVVWPNVLLYIIEKELKVVHEFQADENAATNKEHYAERILDEIFSTHHFSLTHTFFHKPIKRRITMLGKRSSAGMRIRLAVMISALSALLIGSIVFIQGCKRAENKPTATPIQTSTKENTYSIVDKMPVATFDIAAFIGNNLVYPEQARKNSIEGRVVLRFVVNKEGVVQDIEVMKSPDTMLSTAAIDVVKKMPKWTPGEKDGQKVNVSYTLPISFRLGNNPVSRSAEMQRVTENTVSRQPKQTIGRTTPNVYSYVDKMPQFEGDYAAFLSNNLIYPKEAQEKKIEGRVVVKFIIDVNGNIQQPEIVRSPDLLLSQATLDVLKKMPKWIPGEQGGKKVPVYYTLPIVFKL